MLSRLAAFTALVGLFSLKAAELPAPFSAVHQLAPEGEGRAVQGYVLERDGVRMEFTNGTVSPIRLGDRIVGASFVGEGRFVYTPETDVELDHLERRMDVRTVDRGIDRVALFFNDSTWHSLERDLGAPLATPKDAKGIVDAALDYLVDEDDLSYDTEFMTAMINSGRPAFLHAHVDTDEGRDLFYRSDDGEYETVSFGEDARVKGDYYDVISAYVPSRIREGRLPVISEYQPVQTVGYTMQVQVEKGMDFSAVAELTSFLEAPGGTWLPFRLYSKLNVSEITWNGTPMEFVRGDESTSQLWVKIPSDVQSGSAGVMRFVYEGDLLERRRDFYFNKSATNWYPKSGNVDATFDVTFKIHKNFKIMAGGEEVSREEEGDWITTRWVVSRPAIHNSFNVGDFDEETFDDPRVPPVALHYSESAHNAIRGALRQRDMGRTVGIDIVNSLYFFQEAYGPLEVPEFNATEIIAFHGQAFPGMVQLSFATFQWTGAKGGDEIFRAHEVAHQWWGLGVRPATYHDTWLSEGLAEFSGMWYMQRSLMDPVKYLNRLEASRDSILKRRDEAGPVWLGPRLVTSRTRGDYQTIVYEKGAWVVHMLRNLMIDLETMDETPFNDMLGTFYQTYRGRGVTTEQFKEVVEQSVGADMDWFFDQWVYGVDIPKYKWATRGETLSDGSYKVTLAVEQQEADDDFMMLVPVRLGFGEEGFAHVRVLVKGPYTEVELPLLPREPDEIIFNDFESVLAEVEDADWDDLRRP